MKYTITILCSTVLCVALHCIALHCTIMYYTVLSMTRLVSIVVFLQTSQGCVSAQPSWVIVWRCILCSSKNSNRKQIPNLMSNGKKKS